MTTKHKLPPVQVPPRPIIVDRYDVTATGQYELARYKEYNKMSQARACVTRFANYAVTPRNDQCSFQDRRWSRTRHANRCDEFRLDYFYPNYTDSIIRLSQYDDHTEEYVTVEQHEFTT